MTQTKTLDIKPSNKILNLEKYIFVELDELKKQIASQGVDLIDLGIGNPDRPTPKPILKAAIKSIKDPKTHGYPDFRGHAEFQKTIKDWMKKRHGVTLGDNFIAQAVNGGKEGIAHISMAFINPGDLTIVPEPYYPVLSRGTWAAEGEVYHIPITPENDFLPDLDSIPKEIAQRAKMFVINYPNNPTGACAPEWFLEKVVKFCIENEILLISDMAYGEICYDGYRPPSIFSVKDAEKVALEVHTCSKTFNMAGWRVGFVLGRKEFVDSVFAMKLNFDYGTSTIMQNAAIAAMNMPYKHVEKTIKKYQKRRNFLVEEFQKMGWSVKKSNATMYIWLKVPQNRDSKEFCKEVMEKTGVVFTPGVAFGKGCNGYFRVSLVQPMKRLKEAIKRLKAENVCFRE